MAIGIGYSQITTSGLTFCYDTGDILNSYLGQPTTNLITPAANSYPSTGNSWGTYNTNQYCGSNGCGNFWPIPSISSVSNNIVTTSSDHPMRSFDVLRPQTTGGGLTANTDYVVKKISNTQFSLHAYNSSQDGSQGYINPSTGYFKVYDDYMNDVRVSINATSFPTSWWGAPHLPNSGLVKEIITNGFDFYPTKTDCIRLHWHRLDGVTDGMAYNVNAVFTQNVNVTASFWARAVDSNAVGQSISYQNYTYGVTSPTSYSMSCTLGPVGEWRKYSYTFNSPNNNAISYWFPSYGPMTADVANIQIEQKSNATPFTTSTRSNTQGLFDLSRNKTIDLSNVTYGANADISFDGSSFMGIGSLGSMTNFTVELIFKSGSVANYRNPLDCNWLIFNAGASGYSNIGPRLEQNSSGGADWVVGDTSGGYTGLSAAAASSLNTSNFYHMVLTKSGSSFVSYLNGRQVATLSYSSWSGSMGNLNIGRGFSTSSERWFIGAIPIVKVYNRGLNLTEVSQNYNHYKTRFGLS